MKCLTKRESSVTHRVVESSLHRLHCTEVQLLTSCTSTEGVGKMHAIGR